MKLNNCVELLNVEVKMPGRAWLNEKMGLLYLKSVINIDFNISYLGS